MGYCVRLLHVREPMSWARREPVRLLQASDRVVISCDVRLEYKKHDPRKGRAKRRSRVKVYLYSLFEFTAAFILNISLVISRLGN
jgi:hypothetical protein